jgi:diguanylate cyclase (GGDEF)-like protein
MREIPDEMLQAVAVDDDHLAILRDLGFRSAMVVPLKARGSVLGDLALVSAESGRRYGDEDLLLAGRLATRCALAIDNARLYREARESEERLRHQSLHDGLTGLPNRALFLDRLEQALARAERRDSDPALLFFDLDGFKQVNDTYGHLVGDELLRAIPARLEGVLRHEDTISRFGGDEFAVLCADLTDPSRVLIIAERLIEHLRKPFVIGDITLQLGSSIGVAFAGGPHETADSLLHAADAAMYEAKRRGGNRYRLALPTDPDNPAPITDDVRVVASERVSSEATTDPA